MSTKKAISTSFVAIFILIITQIIAQSIASMFVIIKIPTGICNIIAGIIYAGLTYLILKMFISKIIKLPTSDFGMPKFAIKIRWILIAVLLPFVIKGSYLLIFNGKYVSSNMNGNQMVLDHTKVVYTAEDEQGFTFRQINDEDAAVELRARRKKRNRWVLIAFVALLIGMVVSTFFNFDGSDIFVCLYYVIVIFIAGACVLTENANIRQLRKKQVLQHDVVLVQKQPVIETESYGAENIRDTKRFYPILGRDVHSGYESTCFLSEEDYKKREIGDTITMTRFIWK